MINKHPIPQPPYFQNLRIHPKAAIFPKHQKRRNIKYFPINLPSPINKKLPTINLLKSNQSSTWYSNTENFHFKVIINIYWYNIFTIL